MKELRYEIINSVRGLTERYIIVHEDGTEKIISEKNLDTSGMRKLHIRRLPNDTNEIKRRR